MLGAANRTLAAARAVRAGMYIPRGLGPSMRGDPPAPGDQRRNGQPARGSADCPGTAFNQVSLVRK
jgi:hypothetical protein